MRNANEPRTSLSIGIRIAVALSLLIFVGGVVMLFTTLSPLGVYVIVASAVPVGLAFGMQERKFFT